MGKFAYIALILSVCAAAHASWYWPFGDDADETAPVRVSELVEPASLLIEEASDLAAAGKIGEAVEKYRKSLLELDRIERENPDRAQSMEFATVRNKRAYVNAAIDSLLLRQVKANAKAVAVSDTAELERRLAAEKAARAGVAVRPEASVKPAPTAEPPADAKPAPSAKSAKPAKPVQSAKPSRPLTRREQAMAAISRGDYRKAERIVGELLAEKPNNAAALNLKAAMEAKRGDFKAAEATLDQAILSNPRSHFAYYNMARLMLRQHPDDRSAAMRYYETGRAFGGPADENLEARLK